MSTRDFSWGKGGRCVRLTTYHPRSAKTSRKSGALTYPEPLGPPRPVVGDLYLLPFNVIDDDRLLMLVELPTLQELSIAFSYPFFTGGADKSLARPGWK